MNRPLESKERAVELPRELLARTQTCALMNDASTAEQVFRREHAS
jgi:hypothetical protein